jgi:hypothetical protein
MLKTDMIKHLQEQARRQAIENSPMQQYMHAVDRPYHMRKNSSKHWDNFSAEMKAKMINFGTQN